MRMVLVLLSLTAAALCSPGRSEACRKLHQTPFELAESAHRVAVVRVTGAGKRGVGRFEVLRGIKRVRKGATLTPRVNNTSCGVRFRKGRRALVFLRKDRSLAGHYEGFLTRQAHQEEFADAVRRVAAMARAKTDRDRKDVLIDAIETGGAWMAREAAFHLVGEPRYLSMLTATEVDAIATRLETAEHPWALAMIVARLGGPSAKALFDAAEAKRDRRGAYDIEAARSFHRQALKVAATRDRLELAEIIEQGATTAAKAAALSRCELVAVRRLERFSFYSSGVAEHHWATLADRCRQAK